MKFVIFLFVLFVALAQACNDIDRACSIYKMYGHCSPNSRLYSYMRKFCQLTCGFCRGSCIDRTRYCRLYKVLGYCSANSRYYLLMKQQCSKTCAFCNTGIQTPPPVPHSPAPTGNCGISQVQSSRVIAGADAKAGAWPWQVLMYFNGRTMCGGSLVAPNWVVTAAHCVAGRESQSASFKIRAGEHATGRTEGNEQDLAVSRIFRHPQYSRSTIDYDIALMKLSQPARMGKYVNTVCLPNRGNPVAVGTQCYITGWGKIKHPGNMHHTLQQARIPVVSKATCGALNTKNLGIEVTDRMVCAGHGGSTLVTGCHGDSGGPFVCQTGANGKWELHGAVSWGSGTCDAKKSYTVFARVTALRSWIDSTMNYN